MVLDISNTAGTQVKRRLEVRPINIQLLPLPKPNDGTITLSHLRCFLAALTGLKQDRRQRLDKTNPAHKKFDRVLCPVCNLKPVKKTCTGCKIRRYCGRTCQKEDWKVHKKVCITHKSEESDDTILDCLWNTYNGLKTNLATQEPAYDMSTFPTRQDIQHACVVNLKAGQYAPEQVWDGGDASSPEVVEQTLIKLIENIINEIPVEIHEEDTQEQTQWRGQSFGFPGREEFRAAVEKCHPLDQKAYPTCPWNGSIQASRQCIDALPFRDSRCLGARVCASFCTNGEMEHTSGLMMWRLACAASTSCAYCDANGLKGCPNCGMGLKYTDVGCSIGKPKQTVCEKMLFSYMHRRNFKVQHVLFAHRWGEEIATAVGSLLETFGIAWEFQTYEAAVLSAQSNGRNNHPMGLNIGDYEK